MNIFRRQFIKCFYCKEKHLKKTSFLLQYKTADGLLSGMLCESCAKDLERISTDNKDLYDD